MDKNVAVVDFVSSKSVVIWDFDGVIKESIDIKTKAFLELFNEYDIEIKNMIKKHHLNNGGMSRFEKIPIYLSWVGIEPTKSMVDDYCQKFNLNVVANVINSKWVDGVLDFILLNKYNQLFYIVSATPELEIKFIIKELGLSNSFIKIFGAPTKKTEAISEIINSLNREKTQFLMIGDAMADFEAASNNKISFLFRKHESNSSFEENYKGLSIRNFNGI